MRLRTFDAVPADVGDQIKDRLDNVLNNAAQKWNSVDSPKINEIKTVVTGNLQELLKGFLIKAYSTIVSDEERQKWSSTLAAFFKSQLELKLIVETGGALPHVAAEADSWAENLRKSIDLFGNSTIGLTDEYKTLFDMGYKLLKLSTSVMRVGAQWAFLYKDKHAINDVNMQ